MTEPTQAEEAQADAEFGKTATAWRERADLLIEMLEAHRLTGDALGPNTRLALIRVLREAEPPGSATWAIRQGYRAEPPGSATWAIRQGYRAAKAKLEKPRPARAAPPTELDKESADLYVALEDMVRWMRQNDAPHAYVGAFLGAAVYVHRGMVT